MSNKENAIKPSRSEDFPEWYQQVIKAAELAENSPVRGCMIIKPWGYGLWEKVQQQLDQRIKATGHENAYFPLFIPLSFLEKEAAHVEGFAKECAVVTHHRLELKDGKLVPTGELEEPLIVRPTSETIIGDAFSRWIRSYRDLPVLINQWANVVRWEMRTRLFLRTTEFLWQEGHTAHATEVEAREEVRKMLEVYREVVEDVMAIAVIPGEKSANERFPGAVASLTIEAMMQDKKALQAGTSHYLGENFAKAQEIRFLDAAGELKYAHTTSWGASTRLIGGLIMTHADDDGLRIPPRIAPKQVVILPVVPKPEKEAEVFKYAEEIANSLRALTYHGAAVEVIIDKRDLRGGEKFWQWVKKGIPIRIEVGPRDIESRSVMLGRRDQAANIKDKLSITDLPAKILQMLDEIQGNYREQSQSFLRANIVENLKDFQELKELFSGEKVGGFVRAKWSGDLASVQKLEALKLSIRCLPLDQSQTSGKCILTGEDARTDVIIGKSY
jgi:prolyl-tRNA synthetase